MTSLVKKVAVAGRIRWRRERFRWNFRREQERLLSVSLATPHECPICRGRKTHLLRFQRPEGFIGKHLCPGCGHLFTELLQTEPSCGESMFGFGRENDSSRAQEELVGRVLKFSGNNSGSYLDFGCGGNLNASRRAQDRFPDATIFACDTYESNAGGYFQTYADLAPFGSFDGISSYAVVEHLTNTEEAWSLMNRLLKPMSEGGGMMLHAFPSLVHHGFDHWSIQIRSHSCIFSVKSLRMICRRTGFKLVRGLIYDPVGPHDHGVFLFTKVRDLSASA